MKNEFVISKSIAWQIEQSKGFLYIYDIISHNYFKLDGLAKEIWLLLCEKKTIEEIVQSLSKIYQLDNIIEFEQDVKEFVNDLLINNLIKEL